MLFRLEELLPFQRNKKGRPKNSQSEKGLFDQNELDGSPKAGSKYENPKRKT